MEQRSSRPDRSPNQMTSKPDNPFIYCDQVVAGIDLSLRSPAITILHPTTEQGFLVKFNQCHAYYLTDKVKNIITTENITGSLFGAWDTQQGRYETIAEWVIGILQKHKIKCVGLEDYAYSKSISSLTPLAENMGLLKYFLWKNDISYDLYSPSSIKKCATGKGNADKQAMKDAFYQDNNDFDIMALFNKKPIDKVTSPIHDIIDSYYICLSERVATGVQNRNYEKGEPNVKKTK